MDSSNKKKLKIIIFYIEREGFRKKKFIMSGGVRKIEYYFDAPFTTERVRIYCYNDVCYICNKNLRIMTGKSKNGLAPRLIDKETNTTFNKKHIAIFTILYKCVWV
jgi:hypothetical protein